MSQKFRELLKGNMTSRIESMDLPPRRRQKGEGGSWRLKEVDQRDSKGMQCHRALEREINKEEVFNSVHCCTVSPASYSAWKQGLNQAVLVQLVFIRRERFKRRIALALWGHILSKRSDQWRKADRTGRLLWLLLLMWILDTFGHKLKKKW